MSTDQRQQLLDRINRAWGGFVSSYGGLSETAMTESRVTGDWSVKDILAHVTVWEQEALKHLPVILHGGRPPRYSELYGGIDGFNAAMTRHHRDLPLADVLRRLHETHQRLVEYVRNAPEEALRGETRFRRRLRLDSYGHYPKHARAIREWRARSAA